MGAVSDPDLSILITAAKRGLADRLGAAVATVGGEAMRPSFGFVLRAVAAEQPTVSRLAALLGVSKQAASRLADDIVALECLERLGDADDRRRMRLRLRAAGERIRRRARDESRTIEDKRAIASATSPSRTCERYSPTSSGTTAAAKPSGAVKGASQLM